MVSEHKQTGRINSRASTKAFKADKLNFSHICRVEMVTLLVLNVWLFHLQRYSSQPTFMFTYTTYTVIASSLYSFVIKARIRTIDLLL